MAWTALTYAFESVLTSAKMTQAQANFAAVAAGDAGAPAITKLGTLTTRPVVSLGASGAAPYSAATAVLEDDVSHYLNLLSPNTAITGFLFGDPEDALRGRFTYDHSTDTFALWIGGVFIARWNASGQFDGVIPLARLIRATGAGTSGSPITITTSTTGICSTPSMNVTSGDRIWVQAQVQVQKLTSLGHVTLIVQKGSGTATIEVTPGWLELYEARHDIPINAYRTINIAGFMKVTATGTLVMDLVGLTSTDTASIATDNGQLAITVLNNG